MKRTDDMVGTWISVDDASTVELRISKKEKGYTVKAIDRFDGELADILEEKHDRKAGVFSFAAHWDSTGRFTRYRMTPASKGKMEITYTHTDSEILIRK